MAIKPMTPRYFSMTTIKVSKLPSPNKLVSVRCRAKYCIASGHLALEKNAILNAPLGYYDPLKVEIKSAFKGGDRFRRIDAKDTFAHPVR